MKSRKLGRRGLLKGGAALVGGLAMGGLRPASAQESGSFGKSPAAPPGKSGPLGSPGCQVALFLTGFGAFLNLYATQPLLPLFRELFHASELEVSLTVSASVLAVAAHAGPLSPGSKARNRARPHGENERRSLLLDGPRGPGDRKRISNGERPVYHTSGVPMNDAGDPVGDDREGK